MYYVGILVVVKKYIVENLLSDDGYICCFIIIVVFGMGVNCKKVWKIYYMGYVKNLECYV